MRLKHVRPNCDPPERGSVLMRTGQISSTQSSPAERWLTCAVCGFDLKVMPGQLIPPCPRCSAREFKESSGSPQDA
jgi:hypothetical protein